MTVKTREIAKFKSVKVIQPFNYCGVQLRKSMFQEQFNQMKRYYLAISNDDILKGFREQAGLSAPGKNLGGWYSGEIPCSSKVRKRPPLAFNVTFGQWLGAFARMYRVTGEAVILRKLEYLLKERGKTMQAGGYFFYGTSPTGGHYGFDKLVGGLVDTYEYVGEEKSIKYLRKITDWAINNLSRRRIPATPDTSDGGSSIDGKSRDIEWYTLAENFYRAYVLTGDPVYRDFAKIWHYESYWSDLKENKHSMTGLHAYSHVNTLSSAAMAYAVSGDTSYLNTIMNAYEILQKTQVFATGGYGPKERMANQYGSLGNSLYFEGENFENPCGTWAAFKLARYLMMFTGKAIYGDWIETLLYNGIGAALPMAEEGKTYYYCDYKVSGGEKKYYAEAFPCCSGTYPLTVTDYHNIIYFKDKNSLYVNIFIPSQVRWNKSGHTINLIQDTDFPKTERVSLKIGISGSTEFSLKFRIPAWVRRSVSVKLNRKPFSGKWKPGDWGKIHRMWNDGDIVDIEFPLDLYFLPADNYHPNLVALMYGPTVLVADKGGVLQGDKEHPSSWIAPTSDQPLVFQTRGEMNKREFGPYFKYGKGERYYMYHEIEK